MKRILLFLGIFIASASAFANAEIPQDTATIRGVLPNGLTYYIRHNDYIPNRAAFHIAQKVGSIQETPEQRGLAHFLEHMAFNGTKHYPDKALINYLETIGVKFGANLNAYTSVDETVYMITDVPTNRTSTVDSCLLILRDWSDGISLEDKAIDAERGVIEEEWRTRNNPLLRQLENNASVIYAGDKYADCMPIGNMDVVRNCPYDTLRSYYNTWYRPDLQGIVVAGDIDVKRTEEKIKELFADAKVPAGAPERVYYPVSEYKEPCIVISSDAETPYTLLTYSQKVDDIPDSLKNTEEGQRQAFIRAMTSTMLSDRLSDILKEAEPPFVGANAYYGEFLLSGKQKCFEIGTQVSNAGAEVAFTRLIEEVERMRRYGFTESELERAEKSYLALLEQIYNHRSQHKNDYYVNASIQNFLESEPLISDEISFELGKKIASQVTVADVNAWINSWNTNNVFIWFAGSSLENLPTKEFVKNELMALPNKEIKEYEDVELPEAIILDSQLPAKGKILKKRAIKNGAIEYTLSNGVQVYFKQTDFKDDEILLSANSFGGAILLDSTDYVNARFADELYAVGGIGTMNKVQLEKFLSDKRTSLSAFIGTYNEGLDGYASKKDVDYLFQLLYAHFTAVREDSIAYRSYVERFIASNKDRDKYPTTAFVDTVENKLYNDNKLVTTIKIEDLSALDYARSIEIYKERFANAADFKFTIVGSIDETTLEPLLEKYVASLPANKTREKVKRAEPLELKGKDSVRFNKEMQVPATLVFIRNFTKLKSSANKLAYFMLEDILDLVYTEKVREEQGGTYGVSTNVILSKEPTENVLLTIQFSTDAAKVDDLLPIVYAELKNIAENGPREADLQKVKEHKRKTFADEQKSNKYWSSRLQAIQMYGKDNGATYLKRLEKTSAKDIQKAAKALLNSPNLKEIVQVGVNK